MLDASLRPTQGVLANLLPPTLTMPPMKLAPGMPLVTAATGASACPPEAAESLPTPAPNCCRSDQTTQSPRLHGFAQSSKRYRSAT